MRVFMKSVVNVVKLMLLRLIVTYSLIQVKLHIHMKTVARFKTRIPCVASHK